VSAERRGGVYKYSRTLFQRNYLSGAASLRRVPFADRITGFSAAPIPAAKQLTAAAPLSAAQPSPSSGEV